MPGHHLQGALAKELEGLPPFRRYSYVDAFGEGWGLYSEWLGIEAGFYQDPYSDFGRLSYEMWRACRLVVDTGIHAMGWTRQQAIDYLAERTALSRHEVTTEIDRYISWPGQALAYKMGELKIRELRARAEEALGDALRRARLPRRGARERLGAARRARAADRRVHRVAEDWLLLLDRHLDDLAGEGVVALLVVGRHVGLAVQAHVRAFVGGEHEGLGLGDVPFGDLLAVDAQDRLAAGAGLGRVGDELVDDRVLARARARVGAAMLVRSRANQLYSWCTLPSFM